MEIFLKKVRENIYLTIFILYDIVLAIARRGMRDHEHGYYYYEVVKMDF
jgi:hypothetical protein